MKNYENIEIPKLLRVSQLLYQHGHETLPTLAIVYKRYYVKKNFLDYKNV